MKILLDNCVHKGVAKLFAGHEVKTAAQMGWADCSNGVLLAKAADEFDVFVTTDKNLRHQQNLSKLPLPVIELNSADSRIQAISQLSPHFPKALEAVAKSRFVSVHVEGCTPIA